MLDSHMHACTHACRLAGRATALTDLRLHGFGSMGEGQPRYDERAAGLSLGGLVELAPLLGRLELIKCGIAPCAAATLECLTSLKASWGLACMVEEGGRLERQGGRQALG
jgi:hypothetical protein